MTGKRTTKLRVVYSDHAQEQMRRRGIDEEEVEFVLDNADTTFPGTDKKRENLVKEGIAPCGRRLCVVVKKLRQHIVVSAYWR